MTSLYSPVAQFADEAELRAYFSEGFFETLLLKDSEPLFVQSHLDRAKRSIDKVFPDSKEKWDWKLIKDSSLFWLKSQKIDFPFGRFNFFFSLTPEGDPAWAIMLKPYHIPTKPFHATVVSSADLPEKDHQNDVKWLNSPKKNRALKMVQETPFDLVLWKGENDHLLEGHHCNLFYKIDGEIYTPPLNEIVPGTKRQEVMDQFPTIRERSLKASELGSVESMWVTNSLFGVHPVGFIDNQNLEVSSLFSI